MAQSVEHKTLGLRVVSSSSSPMLCVETTKKKKRVIFESLLAPDPHLPGETYRLLLSLNKVDYRMT